MRQARLCAFLIASLVAACGSDGGDKAPVDGSTGGDGEPITIPEDGTTGGDGAEAGGECPRDQVPPLNGFEGTTNYTEADVMACGAACADAASEDCFATNCKPGYDVYVECAFAQLDNCLTQPGAGCRTQWEDLVCCELANGCLEEGLSDAEFDSCVEGKCAASITPLGDCLNANDKQATCGSALTACVTDGGGSGGADGDAGAAVDPGTTTRSFRLPGAARRSALSLRSLSGAARAPSAP